MRSWKVELINTEQRKYIAVQGDTKADHKALRGQMQAGAVTKQARDMVQQRVVSYKREGRQQKMQGFKPHTPGLPNSTRSNGFISSQSPFTPRAITLIVHIIIYHHLSINTDYQLTLLLLLYYNSFQMLS